MRLRALSSAALASVLLLAAARSEATITDDTFWSCDSHETLKVSGSPKVTDDFGGVELDFDPAGNVSIYLPDPDEFYDGTTTAKGASGFLVVPDQASIDDLSDYVASRVQSLTGADSVTIESFTWKIKGKVKDGILKATLKAKGKGSLSIGGRTRRGTGKLTEALLSISD